jgi:hypothetical protein
MLMDGRTDMTKPTVAFRHAAKALFTVRITPNTQTLCEQNSVLNAEHWYMQ